MTFNRRYLAVPAAVSALAMTLAGCGGSTAGGGDTPQAAEGPVTLEVSFWGSDSRVKLTQQAIDLFHSKNPNITVNMQYSDFRAYWDKLATQSAGGEAPDVIQMDASYLASYSSQGSLYDLSKLSDSLDLSTMSDSLRDTGKYQGTQYAAPISMASFAVVVNNDLLNKYGVSLPDTSKWTWDDFYEVAKQVQEKSNGEIIGAYASAYEFPLQLWARQHGSSLYKDGKVVIDPQVLAEYLEMPKVWHENGVSPGVDKWSENIVATSDQQAFGQNKQALMLAPSNQISTYSKATGSDNLTLEPLPSDVGTTTKWNYFKPGQHWSISSKSEHPVEAAKFIDFMINDADAAKILGIERGDPANNANREALAKTLTGADKKALEFDSSLTDSVGEAPEVTPNGASGAEKMLTRYVQEVSFGRMSPIDGAKGFIEELQRDIDAA
ncbi:ABC transporter substrate-binding protein [Bifidobacterium avesanii]|uniref:Extracellular solute-binding protein n=1 Tax=Bifidobacterium avesanii TaxID=1798157 RepID=A0A7K3THH8_9BIFI|nr:extracellular solute-binding protein [Bifidobacterium avesanii]KAB8292627.1 ABC transporter substrate-binding protein [Bifidobacterium avesanii]NEG78545.1 extracellular solute-binding protein [Bifidobacterium avesanii]